MMVILRLFFGCLEQLIPYAFLCLYPFRRHFRFSHRKTFLGTVAVVAAASFLFALSGLFLTFILPRGPLLLWSVNGFFLLFLILCFLWYQYCVKDIWQKKLFIFSFTMTAALLISSLYNCIIAAVVDGDWLPYGPEFYPAYLPAVAASLLPCWLLLKYFYLPIEDALNAKESGYLSVLSLLLCVLILPVLILAPEYAPSNPIVLYLFFTLLVTIFVVYMLVFRMYGLTREKMLSQQETMQFQHQNELSAEQYRRIHDQIEYNRKMRHDLIHHLLAIRSFLGEGKAERAEEYLNQYLKETENYTFLHFCGNPVVNMLVSHYDALSREQGIDFSVRVSIPDSLPIQDIDLSVLLGNLLDNAVRAAAHAPEENRFVRLNMICSGKMLAIAVDNGFDGNVRLEGGRYLSTKPGHLGMGLKSLDDISKKYHGGVEFTHDGTEFHASVMAGLEETRERS